MNTPHHYLPRFSFFIFLRDHPSRGFTMVELLVVLAIVSILAAVGVPAMKSVGVTMKLSSLSNDFVSHLYLARSEAIKRNGRVVICKSADGLACSVDGGWERGWMVFHDANNNGLHDAGESLIQRGDALPDGYRLAGNQNVGHYISFSPVGMTQMTSGAFQAGTLTLCPPSSEHVDARQVVINAVGRLRIQKTTVASCA